MKKSSSAAVVIFVTASSDKEASRIGRTLVRERLAACVTSLRGVKSEYRWKGKLERATEVLLMIKTMRRTLTRLTKRVRELHSYEVPEILALPVLGGNADYLQWLRESVR